MTRTFALLILTTSALPARAEPERQITGTLLGHDGKPMRLAEVHIHERTVPVGRDGAFRIAAPAARLTRLRLSGLDHAEHEVALVSGGDIALDVRLGTHPRPAAITAAEIVVIEAPSKEHMDGVVDRIAMQRRPDGTFAADVERPGTEMRYEISIPTVANTINGTQADRFTYDGGGDYAGHVALHGRTTIVFDPSRLPPPGRSAQVILRNATRTQREVARIAGAVPPRVTPKTLAGAPQAPTPEEDRRRRDELQRALAGERDPLVRAALLTAYFASQGRDPAIARQIAGEVAADSEIWDLWPSALGAIATVGTTAERDYVGRAIATVDERKSAGMTLFALGMQAHTTGRTDIARFAHHELTTKFSDLPFARMAARFDTARKLIVGAKLPEIDAATLDDPKQRITLAALRGKLVLVDFWATWCKGCVDDLPALQALHTELGDRLTIVTVDTHDTPDEVRTFRKARFAMPWHHVVIEEGPGGAMAKLFEADILPTSYLVDGTGTIVATGDALRGKRLAETVKRALEH